MKNSCPSLATSAYEAAMLAIAPRDLPITTNSKLITFYQSKLSPMPRSSCSNILHLLCGIRITHVKSFSAKVSTDALSEEGWWFVSHQGQEFLIL